MMGLFSAVVLLTAQTYQLSGDTLVRARVPAGIIALNGRAQPERWAGAEVLIWAGAGDRPAANALVAALSIKHPDGWAELSAGRMIVTAGAIMPVHMDGVKSALRLPWGTQFQAFGGAPVGPTFTGRGGDWLAGGRISQKVLQYGVIGFSIIEQRDEGERAQRELGVDLAVYPLEGLHLSARGAYDLLSAGVSEVQLNAGATLGTVRLDLFGVHRSAARRLPATSIFSVLGDSPARSAGGRVTWRAAPRLDLSATGALLHKEGFGEELRARGTLRLDAKGRSAVSLELRRDGTPDASWVGVRAITRVALPADLGLSAELELVRPDGPLNPMEPERGALWPWALIAASWRPVSPVPVLGDLQGWELAFAVEAGSGPSLAWAIDALARLAYRWSAQ